MDKHYLTPLFAPQSIVVFAGQADDPATQTPQAKALHEALAAQRYSGRLAFVDIHNTTGSQEPRRFAKRDGRREFKELG